MWCSCSFSLRSATDNGAQEACPLPLRRSIPPYHEISPVPHPDGASLYFARAKHPANVGGVRDVGDLWHVTRSSAEAWGTPHPVVSAPNSAMGDFPIGFSEDGQLLYYVHQSEQEGTERRIAFSKAEGRHHWSSPTLCTIPYFKNFSDHLSGWVSQDEAVMVLSLQNYHTHGQEDLYICFKKDGAWGPLENMGLGINSERQEVTPYVSSDGTLFFSSNREGGKGSFDVYHSTRLDDTWKRWSVPTLLEGSVNTRGSERYFRVADDGENSLLCQHQEQPRIQQYFPGIPGARRTLRPHHKNRPIGVGAQAYAFSLSLGCRYLRAHSGQSPYSLLFARKRRRMASGLRRL